FRNRGHSSAGAPVRNPERKNPGRGSGNDQTPPPAHSNSGVDARQKSSDNEKAVNTHRLSLGFAWTPKDRAVGPWRQRSTSSRDQKFVDQSSAQEKRTIRVGSQGAAVAVLICGELFNPQLEGLCLREIAFRQCLVDPGDAGSGTIIRRAEIAPGTA